MKRKLIKHGNSSLSVTLPAKWAARFGLKKGDTVNVEEMGSQLILSTREERRLERIEIDITGLDSSLIRHHIRGAYILGYDEIDIRYAQESAAALSKRGKHRQVPVATVIEETATALIGMEIIEHTRDRAVLKDLSSAMADEFDTVLRRIFTMLLAYGEETIEAIRGGDKDLLANLRARNLHIDRFITFCFRFLHKKGFTESATLRYVAVQCLYEINLVYAFICKEQSKSRVRIAERTVQALSEINNLFREASELYFAYSGKKLQKIIEERAALFERINILNTKLGKHDTLLLARAVLVVIQVYELTKIRLMLQKVA